MSTCRVTHLVRQSSNQFKLQRSGNDRDKREKIPQSLRFLIRPDHRYMVCCLSRPRRIVWPLENDLSSKSGDLDGSSLVIPTCGDHLTVLR